MILEEFLFKTGDLSIGGLESKYHEDCNYASVCLHGFGDQASGFLPLLENLGKHGIKNFMCPDFIGHGHSDHLPEGLFYLFDITCFLTMKFIKKKTDKPVILIGHSLGGSVAAAIASVMPERVKGLVLLDSTGPLSESPDHGLERLRSSWKKFNSDRAPKNWFYKERIDAVRIRMTKNGISRESAEILCDRALSLENGYYRWKFDPAIFYPSPVYRSEDQVTAILGAVECPVLLLKGKHTHLKDELFNNRIKAFRDIRCVELDSNHYLHMEKAVEAAEYINEFYRNTLNV